MGGSVSLLTGNRSTELLCSSFVDLMDVVPKEKWGVGTSGCPITRGTSHTSRWVLWTVVLTTTNGHHQLRAPELVMLNNGGP